MAEYSNAYLPGTIIGLSNESPKQRGISSGIDLNNADNIPALQFWSDITFLQYMSMFPMRPLQAIIQQNVYNLETKEAVDAIRHIDYNLRDEPILTDYPQFPGLQLDYGSKAFFALLAVPVGRSIALMLSTHRDELRPLCVWEIRVWWDTGMENTTIWYRIKVTPCGPPRGPAGPAKRSNNDLQSDPGRLGKRVDPAYISAPSTPEDDMKLLTTLSKAGGAWAVALDSNDPKYWEHGVYQYGQLQEKTAKWGWTLESSMQSSAAAMLPATVPVFKDIYGKDLSKISMWSITWKHTKEVTSFAYGEKGISGVLGPSMAENSRPEYQKPREQWSEAEPTKSRTIPSSRTLVRSHVSTILRPLLQRPSTKCHPARSLQ